MIKIEGMHISVTRGDCEPFTITFTGEDVPEDGAKVLFSVKQNADMHNVAFEKQLTLEDSKVEVQIMNADTKNLPFADYEWDVRFPDFCGYNEPHTPMEPAIFTVARVIGNV